MFNKNNKIQVRVDKSHLFTLGEKMYKESIEFVRELVNNAYDADATEVRVMIGENKITVEDDGSGMNEKGLEQFFTIGSEEKRIRNISPRFGRKRIGQFGIGKFSALSLANQFIIQSTKGKGKYSVIFNKSEWQKSNRWELPIKKEKSSALDKEGTMVILNMLIKKVSLGEMEKYLRQSVPIRAKKFHVYLNNKKISARTATGKAIPIKIKTMYGLIEGEIIIALNSGDVEEPGVECRVKQVFIKRDFFGLNKKYHQVISRVTGSINADFLPLISSRSDFIVDSPEYKLFYQLIQAELGKVLKNIKNQSEIKNIKKITKELQDIMRQVRGALELNPNFVPQGKAVARLKKEGRKKTAVAGAYLNNSNSSSAKEIEDKKMEKNKKEDTNIKNAVSEIKIKPLVMKRIRLNKLGISCSIVSLGERGPEVASQGNAVYINQDHPLYQQLYKKRDLLSLHLLRLITQEIVLMKKLHITAREAFAWQSKLLKDAIYNK